MEIAVCIILYIVLLIVLLVTESVALLYINLSIAYWVSVYVLFAFNILGAKKGAKLAEQDKKKYLSIQKQQKMLTWLLQQCESFAHRIGGEPNPASVFEWDFILMRCTKSIELINRRVKAIELLGGIKIIQFLLIVVCTYGFLMSFSAVWATFIILGFIIPSLVRGIFRIIINEQDRELERDFPDLFLLLYCNLAGGVNSRIAPALSDFLRSCDALYSAEEHLVIRRFVRDLQNNIEVYADESEALVHMRDKYKSATIVNFCNLATQSLRGVDTKDHLLAFKVELTEKQKVQMEKEAKARVETGRRAIIFVYVILCEFILLSWASKLGL